MRDLKNDPNYEIRYFEPGDASFIMETMMAPSLLALSPPGGSGEVEEVVKLWIAFARFRSSLIALYKGKPVGAGLLLLMPYLKVSHQALLSLCVAPGESDYTKSLIRNLLHLGKTHFRLEMVACELMGDHPYERDLKEEGFKEVFRQERFLKRGEEYFPRKMWEREC